MREHKLTLDTSLIYSLEYAIDQVMTNFAVKNVTAGRAGEELLCGDLAARAQVHHRGWQAHRGESHLDHPLHLRHVSDDQLHDPR